MSMAAGGAYILSQILGALCFILFGGRYRVFYTGLFGVALVGTLLLFICRISSAPTGEAVLMYLGISIVLPMTIAQVVSVFTKERKTPESE
jgi:hypothetical protein